jgi:hypothetical protein
VGIDEALVASDGMSCRGWAGFRLAPVLGGPPRHRNTDHTETELEARVAADESAWLASLWSASGSTDRFEIRYRNDPRPPGSINGRPRLLRCACLCRAEGSSTDDAASAAIALRDRLALSLPGHVRPEPMAGGDELFGWLVPFDAPAWESGQAEIAKVLTCRPAGRRNSRHRAIVSVSRYSTRRVSWEPTLRRLAELPFPAVLSIGIKSFPRSEALRVGLEQLADDYEKLAQPVEPSMVLGGAATGDRFAEYAAERCKTYARQYYGPAFRLRISLAAAQPLPDDLPASIAGALSGQPDEPGAHAMVRRPGVDDRYEAWRNLTSLGAVWMRETYLGQVPEHVVMPELRELLNLADLAEAGSVVHLPVAWPGRPQLYAEYSAPAPPRDDYLFGGGLRTSRIGDPTLD